MISKLHPTPRVSAVIIKGAEFIRTWEEGKREQVWGKFDVLDGVAFSECSSVARSPFEHVLSCMIKILSDD